MGGGRAREGDRPAPGEQTRRLGRTNGVREFSSDHSYPQPPSALLALWRDPEFLAAVNTRFGGVGEPRVEEAGDRVLVHTRRQLPLDKLPGFVRRFVSSGLLEQTDDWPREAVPPIEGTWSVSGKMPATMAGSHAVRPDGDGCLVSVHGSVTVNAPLISGKVEDLVVREIDKLIHLQQDFAADWLAGKLPTSAPARS
jgi:hypothetical protein